MMLAALLLALVTSELPAASSPQDVDNPIRPLMGHRIRVTDSDRHDGVLPRSFVGTLAEYDGTVLAVAVGRGRRTLYLEHVEKIEVSRGKRSVPLTALAVAAGGFVGLIAGGLASGGIEGGEPIRFWGALSAGPLLGGSVGWSLTRERWRTVHLPGTQTTDHRRLHLLGRETDAILDLDARPNVHEIDRLHGKSGVK